MDSVFNSGRNHYCHLWWFHLMTNTWEWKVYLNQKNSRGRMTFARSFLRKLPHAFQNEESSARNTQFKCDRSTYKKLHRQTLRNQQQELRVAKSSEESLRWREWSIHRSSSWLWQGKGWFRLRSYRSLRLAHDAATPRAPAPSSSSPPNTVVRRVGTDDPRRAHPPKDAWEHRQDHDRRHDGKEWPERSRTMSGRS